MNAASVKTHFAHWREWEFNPVVVRELRQAVRSWAISGLLMLFLIVMFVAALAFLADASMDFSVNTSLGSDMFTAFVVILIIASVFFIPLYVGTRMGMERQENNPDLMYASTLSPGRIVRGKFYSGAYLGLLFFSACMPFMAFTNLLRGVDLPTVFIILGYLYVVVCAANMVAIFLACVPASRPLKILLVLYSMIQSIFVVGPLVALALEFVNSGVGSMFGGRGSFWWAATAFLASALMSIIMFYVLAVALISPASANRALPVRLVATGLWLAAGLIQFIWSYTSGGYAMSANLWEIVTFIFLMFALIVSISNSDHYSSRVRRAIPTVSWKKWPAFLFYNGAAGGLLWAAFLGGVTYMAVSFTDYPRAASGRRDFMSDWFVIGLLYAFDYALVGLIVQRKFFRRGSPKLAGLLAAIVAGLFSVGPSIVLFFVNRLSWDSFRTVQPGNAFNMASNLNDAEMRVHFMVALGWLLVMLILNARWFRARIADFQPVSAAPPMINP